jgi:hypothetical protein
MGDQDTRPTSAKVRTGFAKSESEDGGWQVVGVYMYLLDGRDLSEQSAINLTRVLRLKTDVDLGDTTS